MTVTKNADGPSNEDVVETPSGGKEGADKVDVLHGLSKCLIFQRITVLLQKIKTATENFSGPEDIAVVQEAYAACEELSDLSKSVAVNPETVFGVLGIRNDDRITIGIQGAFHHVSNVLTTLMGWLGLAIQSLLHKDDISRLRALSGAVLELQKVMRQVFYKGENIIHRADHAFPSFKKRIEDMAGDRDIEFVVDIEDNLPDRGVKLSLNLVYIFVALKDYARNAIDAGADRMKIIVEDRDGTHVKIRIQNNGIPIPEGVVSRIYEPHFTYHAPGQEVAFGGAGSGSAGIKYFIEEMGGGIGEIDCEKTEKQGGLGGPEFVFYLPKAKG
ncbi:MAG: ATP-binding protein [Patescibacteria group bacterium]|nr:hypothetical protein [Patescibacteria group bacterium]